jgi:tRNA A37 threonylcarbamoyladenosine synthetase subunit TsaC/SUA5/YrdC
MLEDDAREVYARLLRGELVLAPTETGYGLVAMGPEAVERIYRLKGRPREKPCVTVATLPILDDVGADVSPSIRAWIASASRAWPLAVVARANADSRLLAATPSAVRAQCTKDDTVALFFGVGPLLSRVAELAFADGRLVVGSSANLAGTGNNAALADVPRSMRDGVDFEVDHGPARFGNERRLASSLLDLPSARFLREGVCFGEIEASWERR